MKAGKSAKETLEGLLASDPQKSVRQVAMIDKYGIVVAHTGNKCIDEAGHKIGKNYSVQANLMEKNTVWDAMAKTFESTEGDLAEKMMASLEAAQKEGGDIRGKQSAAMLVVKAQPSGRRWEDRVIDLRVDDSKTPLKELRRLLNVASAYKQMDKGYEYIALEDFDKATIEYQKASDLSSGNPEILYWYAVTLVTANQIENSLPIFKEVFKQDENWKILIPRLVKAELLPDDDIIISKIMAQ